MKNLTWADNGIILEEIKKATSILLHCHTSADGDSVGSALGLRHVLAAMGKKVTVIQSDTPVPNYLSFLPGFDLIEPTHFHDLDLSRFDLFVILDTASPEKITSLKPIQFPLPIKTICIDHHASNTGYADINFIPSDYPAACAILGDLVRMWNAADSASVPFPAESALCFFIGMYTDTGGFRYPLTSSKTFELAAFLTAKAPDFTKYIDILENSRKKDQIYAKRIFLNNLETWFNDTIVFASASHAELLAAHVNPMEANGSDLASMFKSVVGWEIGIAMVEQMPGHFKTSFRARNGEVMDLTKIVGLLGGGGHKAAAGATIDAANVLDAKALLKEKIAEAFPELQE